MDDDYHKWTIACTVSCKHIFIAKVEFGDKERLVDALINKHTPSEIHAKHEIQRMWIESNDDFITDMKSKLKRME